MRWVVEQTNGEFVSWGLWVCCVMGVGVGVEGGLVHGVDYDIITPLAIFHLFHLLSVSASRVIGK